MTIASILNTVAAAAEPEWTPFLDPLDIHEQWLWLMPPLLFAVALVYKTLKMPTLRGLPIQTLRLGAYIFSLMAIAGVALWQLIEWV